MPQRRPSLCFLSCLCLRFHRFAFVSTTSGGANVVGEVLSIVRHLWGSLRLHLKVRCAADEMDDGGVQCLDRRML